MRRWIPALVAAALIVAGCSSNADDSGSSASSGVLDAGAASAWVTVTGGCDAPPALEIATTATPPTELVIADLCPGSGDAVPAGATVTAHYVGVSLSSAAVFDSSWDRGEPETFPLSGVIAGWQEGLPGMAVGGRRILVIPPDLGYSDFPPPGSSIAPGETLIFVVDMVAVS